MSMTERIRMFVALESNVDWNIGFKIANGVLALFIRFLCVTRIGYLGSVTKCFAGSFDLLITYLDCSVVGRISKHKMQWAYRSDNFFKEDNFQGLDS